MEKYEFVAAEGDAGTRLDKFLTEKLKTKTRSAVQRYIEDGNVKINQDKTVTKNYRLYVNDIIALTIPQPVELTIEAQDIPLDIVYEDEWLLVVNKPKGMVVHPAVGNYSGTLVNALMFYCKGSLSGINGVIRPGIVHRIDKDTSGLLIVAKTDQAHQGLAAQIQEHSFTRVYETVVYGNIKEDKGTINQPIGRHPTERKKMAVVTQNARQAVTHYEVLNRFGAFTHLRVKLETGRTHQIRVHMAHIYHPVAGDPVYGPKKPLKFLGGQCLHAKEIGFIHPVTGEELYFSSPLPEYFSSFLTKLERGNVL